MNSQEILAVVAGENITNADLDAFLQGVPKEQKLYAQDPQFRDQFLEQMIAFRCYAKYGEEMGLEETDDFKSIMANLRKEVLAQLAINNTVKAGAVISQEEAKAYYEANKARFEKGATVHAKQILVPEEAQCLDILEAINKGDKAFEEAAMESSTCPSKTQGGDLGEFGKGQMVKEFEDAAFSAEIGQVVGPVATQFGFHLIKVEAKKEATVAAFEEVKEQIRRNLLSQKQNQAYSAKAAELKAKYM